MGHFIKRGNKHMKNYKVRPEHIIDLVGKVAASFNAWQLEYNHLPVNMRAEYMHYMSDMLDSLIKTAYPLEEQKVKDDSPGDALDALVYGLNLKPINPTILNDIEKGFQEIAKLMKDCKPPRAGEF